MNNRKERKTIHFRKQVRTKARFSLFFHSRNDFILFFLLVVLGANKKFGAQDRGSKPTGKFQNGKGKFGQKPAPNKFAKPDGQSKNDGQTKPAAPEKVDWNKFKQEKKDLRLKRKMTKTGFEKISEAKQIYEKLKW